jgi:hypothetical protein
MTELEKVEKLREKANVGFAEAKEALENSGGDILDALIYLENRGKATVPAGGGFFSGADAREVSLQTYGTGSERNDGSNNSGEAFSDLMKKLGKFCLKVLHKGNTNFLEAWRGGEHLFSCPVTVLVILLIFFFWVTIPFIIISMFFGLKYRFSGKDLGKDSVNSMMDGASNVVEDVKKSFTESANNADNADDNTDK